MKLLAMLSWSSSADRSFLKKLLVALFIFSIAAASALSCYGSGNWTLKRVPELTDFKALKAIQQNGLALPGWQTLEQRVVQIGGHKWSVQAIVPDAVAETATPQQAVLLMLRPQVWHQDMPEVEWMDIQGARRWTTDSQRSLTFTVVASNHPVPVKARFLRGWTTARTDAVVEWYAWPTGGHPAPSHWFWADQGSQWRDRQHQPWVAVSLLLPIQPLDELETARSTAESLARQVQSALLSTAFVP